ncbi:MAG: anhydro-N-acetylmuramic acid kinase, partial [Gammaproteobacteria bacterium]|nr:anhydro-N-acetylmuramic acid kinase [Gammaproteobacteria bacterium]
MSGKQLYIGLMSGTSADGVDAALVSFDGDTTTLLKTHFTPYSDATRAAVQALMKPGENELMRIGELDTQLGEYFATAALELCEDTNKQDVVAIGSHGQTVRHHPNAALPFTMQLGNGAIIAERTGITTITDFRSADIAAGGQGAPLAPGFHNAVFRSQNENRVILNIGGIANITYLPADTNAKVTGFDTGPGNTLLDSWTKEHKGQNFDRNGEWAAQGLVNQHLLETMLKDDYFRIQPPKSTGQEYFNRQWLGQHLIDFEHLSAQDVQATLLQLTVQSIAHALGSFLPTIDAVYVCGGGANNSILLSALNDALPDCKTTTTADLGIDPDWVEAVAFAWLAKQTLEGKPGNIPTVTGARHECVLGAV